ncbi:competence protein CoiA family protein [Metapseudomonas phytobenefica]
MEYAFNEITGRLESAAKVSFSWFYVCPVCKARVLHRSGVRRRPHFAHWPGMGSPECEIFVPGLHGQYVHGQASATMEKRRMELRLVIPRIGDDRAGWSLELVLPPCRECPATLSLDVGGRIQTLNMRGMQNRRRVTAELSTTPYCIVEISGKPDSSFFLSLDRECQGLPAVGAAAFTASGRSEPKGFPRTQELRVSETFALLWREPAEPDFPDELVIDRFPGRQGWNLALVTIPDELSPECTDWLRAFTGLPIAPPVPAIIAVWPFFTRKASVNVIESVRTGMLLLAAKMMPLEQSDQGPTMQVQSGSSKHSAQGLERSPAFFALRPDGTQTVKVSDANTPGIEEFVSFTLNQERSPRHPSVELAFTTPTGVCHVVPLHQRRCTDVAAEARAHGRGPDYLSMPPGAVGILRIDGPTGRLVTAISSGSDSPPHSRHTRLPSADVLTKMTSALADPACHVEIEFGGFGRLRVAGTWTRTSVGRGSRELTPALRSRLLSFMLQLRIASPTAVHADDNTLVGALATVRPEASLIPHYRSLVKEVLACGFEIKRLGEGASP